MAEAETESDRLEALFGKASELEDPAARQQFVGQACGGDAGLRRRLEALLRRHDDSKPLWSLRDVAAAGDGWPEVGAMERGGDEIGHYRLIGRIGEGGFSVVFAAEQIRPVRRPVAIKILKPGLESAPILARFARERQTLARLQHPHVACMHDAGSTPGGRPYFVMERVEGLPITRYCDERRLPLRDRLALFVLVCRAAHYAHQKGILHRDLKPANILVGDGPAGPHPKVIDFGIAKALCEEPETGALTRLGEGRPGTPAYMSPEQAGFGPDDIDIRSDVYALGAVLHELLVELEAVEPEACRSPETLARHLREAGPVRPSRRLRSCDPDRRARIASRRGTTAGVLEATVARDLDWIVGRAMATDRDRRYDTAESLARDVDRFLAGEAVEARPASRRYQAAKFIARHRVLAGAVAAVLVAAVLGMLGIGWGLHEARREAATARAEEAKVRQLVDLMFDAFSRADPTVAGRADYTVRDLLKDLARSADAGEIASPAVECLVRDMLCFVFHQFGDFREAQRHAETGLQLARDAGAGSPIEAGFHLRLGEVLKNTGPAEAATHHLGRALAIHREMDGPEHPATLRVALLAGRVLQRSGRTVEGFRLAEAALASARRQQGAPWYHEQMTRALHMVGLMHGDAGHWTVASELAAERLERCRRRLPDDHPEMLHALADLGLARLEQGAVPEADAMLTRALAGQRRALGSDYPHTLETMVALARARARRGDRSGSAALFQEAFERSARVLGGHYPDRRRWIHEAAEVGYRFPGGDGQDWSRIQGRRRGTDFW